MKECKMKEATNKEKTTIGNSIFYVNEKNGIYNFNRVNEKTNKTFHYKNENDYNKAIIKAKQKLI